MRKLVVYGLLHYLAEFRLQAFKLVIPISSEISLKDDHSFEHSVTTAKDSYAIGGDAKFTTMSAFSLQNPAVSLDSTTIASSPLGHPLLHLKESFSGWVMTFDHINARSHSCSPTLILSDLVHIQLPIHSQGHTLMVSMIITVQDINHKVDTSLQEDVGIGIPTPIMVI